MRMRQSINQFEVAFEQETSLERRRREQLRRRAANRSRTRRMTRNEHHSKVRFSVLAVCLTATVEILKAIARGDGPASAVLALGYAGWAPGQLENEIQQNGWLHCTADKELIFGTDIKSKYDKALNKLCIDLAMLSNEAGHA